MSGGAPAAEAALIGAVRHYLGRAGALLGAVEARADAADLLARRLAPDMMPTGDHLALAMRFAARALGPPAGVDAPDIPEGAGVADLRAYHARLSQLVAPLRPPLGEGTIAHVAGEAALEQGTADYVARFALPNLLFHLSMAYAALRVAGVPLGKADFDGLHRYGPGG